MVSASGRELSPGEATADAAIHLIGLAAATGGAIMLIGWLVTGGGWPAVAAASVYAFGLIAMFGCSTVYNFSVRRKNRDLWRRLDHAAIFVMIAGTYTPFTTGALSGAWAFGLTFAVWVIAAVGIAVKLLRAPARSQKLSAILYITFGWMAVLAAKPFVEVLSPTVIALVVAGGVVYTLGTFFFAHQQLPYQRALWHGFVLAGAAIHFCAVVAVLAPPA